MTYAVKEIFYTLQGEGARTGRAAVFCRFAGCNLWSGREQDRETAQCRFCDTDFVGTNGKDGGKFDTAEDLAIKIASYWPDSRNGRPINKPYVVFTGGEPLLQLNNSLIKQLQAIDFEVAIETNGTLASLPGVDWICVSPKAGTRQILTEGHELKLVYPQEGIDPRTLEKQQFGAYFVQPMDGPNYQANLKACILFCQKNPIWRLSLQVHKILGIP
ncbi:MAG: 7-carboxy-7-deazaguanine synthase [Rhodospirillaceae bacterium]